MRASDREYAARFWIFAAIFAASFTVQRGPRVWEGVRGVIEGSNATALRATLAIAAAIAALAALLRTWAAAYLTSDVVQDGALRTEALVADGPYRRVRNPLYLGTIVYGVAMGMLGTIAGWCVLVVALVVFVYRLIGHEEAALIGAQKGDYVAYCDAVPRLWPSARPRLPASARVARWGQAAVGESFLWLSAIACTLGAACASRRVALATLGVGFVAWIGVRRAIRVKARPGAQPGVHAPVSPPDDR